MGLPGILEQRFRAGGPGGQQVEMAQYRTSPGRMRRVGDARSQRLGLGYITAPEQHIEGIENQPAGVGGRRAQR